LDKVKNCIIEFYKTNDKNIYMNFDYVVKNTGLSESNVDKALRQLIDKGFIKDVQYADDVPVNFTILTFLFIILLAEIVSIFYYPFNF